MRLGIFLICLGVYLASKLTIFTVSLCGDPNYFVDWLFLGGIALVFGGVPIFFGVRRIYKRGHQQEALSGSVQGEDKKVEYFRYCNCEGCVFFRPEEIGKAGLWCASPDRPNVEGNYCYSRRV